MPASDDSYDIVDSTCVDFCFTFDDIAHIERGKKIRQEVFVQTRDGRYLVLRTEIREWKPRKSQSYRPGFVKLSLRWIKQIFSRTNLLSQRSE